MLLKYIYTVFLGLLITAFIGIGIAAFYPAPTPPRYAVTTPRTAPPDQVASKETAAEIAQREADDKRQREFEVATKIYNRAVSLLALAGAIVVLAISLTAFRALGEIADGLLLGGVFTLLYSIGRSFASDSTKYQFSLVSLALIIGVSLGYLKFIAPRPAKKKLKPDSYDGKSV